MLLATRSEGHLNCPNKGVGRKSSYSKLPWEVVETPSCEIVKASERELLASLQGLAFGWLASTAWLVSPPSLQRDVAAGPGTDGARLRLRFLNECAGGRLPSAGRRLPRLLPAKAAAANGLD